MNGPPQGDAGTARTPGARDGAAPSLPVPPDATERPSRLETLAGVLLGLLGTVVFAVNLSALETNHGADITLSLLPLWLWLLAAVLLRVPLARRILPRRDAASTCLDAPAHEAEIGTATTAAALAGILLLALVLRLLDPLSNPVIGDADPYVHMTRAWNLAQLGQLPRHYPPGFIYLIAPLTQWGPQVFYLLARFLPPFTGVVEVAGLYVLARRGLGRTGALSAAFLVAVMPENVLRTNLLFPTALDLALLPWILVLVLEAEDGSWRAAAGAVVAAGFLFAIHPWVLGLVLPPLFVYLLAAHRVDRRVLVGVLAGALAALAAGLALYPHFFNPAHHLVRHVDGTLSEILAAPWILETPPANVNLPFMLTTPALLLAALGSARALAERRRLHLLALAWTGLLLPLVLVDWFQIWYLPVRTVAYLSLGVALLGGVAVEGLVAILPRSLPQRRPAFGAVAAGLLLVTAPAAANLATGHGWDRMFDAQDYQTWRTLANRDPYPPMVMTASWQSQAGYRAITGRYSAFDPAFFNQTHTRTWYLRNIPDLLVLVDGDHARESHVQLGFLSNWTVVYKHGDDRVYAPPNHR